MRTGVLQVCLSRGWGGLEMYPVRIAPALEARGWRVFGLSLEGSRVSAAFAECCEDNLVFKSVNTALIHVLSIRKWIRKHNIGIVHCHKSSDLRLAAVLKILMPSLRLIFTEHMGVSKPKHDLYHRWAYSKVDKVLSISRETLARNRKALPVSESQLSLLYQGLDLSKYPARLPEAQRAQLRQALGISHEQVAVAVAARITPGKGQMTLIKAIAALPKPSPVVGILLGGLHASDGSNEAYVQQLKQTIENEQLTEQVIMPGYQADLPEWLAAMDIVCVPSRNEAFGLAAIEAMAAGRPVIGSDSGALPEILQGVGKLVAPDDPTGWSKAIQQWVEHPDEASQLGRRGRQRVEEMFTLEKHLEGLERIYLSTRM
ncbi:D-inositol-3-phosphate glycosyltransferase [Halomonadaceae bacterium LMG 33818]|uniref:glycosyltransferase family 4 protein n=1 Tax=Cernens ardua TaxID=3402176 RepID=UPI003EDB830C